MITVKVKTIWHGKVGIHQKYIQKAKENRESLEFKHGIEFMVIPHEEIDSKLIGKSEKPFIDKYNNEIYYLFYFNWLPTFKPLTLF